MGRASKRQKASRADGDDGAEAKAPEQKGQRSKTMITHLSDGIVRRAVLLCSLLVVFFAPRVIPRPGR